MHAYAYDVYGRRINTILTAATRDNHGSVMALTDAAAIEESGERPAFGKSPGQARPNATQCDCRISPNRSVDASAMAYYGLRYYSPELGGG